MIQTPSPVPSTRPRWRSLLASLTLVGALVATSAALPATADVVGTGPGTISGTVTATGDGPLAGVFVNVSQSAGEGTSFSASTTTDASGHYEFSGLDAGTYAVQANAYGYQYLPGQQAEVSEAAPTATVDFTFVPFAIGVGTISGHVTADGVPLAGTNVTASSFATGQNLSTTSDENGYYEIDALAEGQWNISAYAGGDYQYLNIPAVEITAGTPTVTVDVPFLSWPVGTSIISGVLKDSATHAPIPNVSISAFGIDVAQSSGTTTDAAGAFNFTLLPAGTYSLNFIAIGYLSVVAEVHVAEGQSVTVNRSLIPANATISGQVSDQSGAPIAGIYVDAHTEDGNFGGAVTDENGQYVMSELGAVSYTLNIGGVSTLYVHKDKTVTAKANKNVKANFTLKKRTTGAILGFVTDATTGAQLEGFCVTVFKANKKVIVTTGVSYADGTYTIDELAPGSYKVKFNDCDHTKPKYAKEFYGEVDNWQDATPIAVVAGVDFYDGNISLDLKH